MSKEDAYLGPNQSALLGTLYLAINKYKTDRMWTPNGTGIASYAEYLFPDLEPLNPSDVSDFIMSPEAADLVRRAPLPNLKTALTESVISASRFGFLGEYLGVVKIQAY